MKKIITLFALLTFGFLPIVFGTVANITSVTSTTDDSDTKVAGDIILITVTFDQIVTVAGGSPLLALNSGGVATYSTGSPSTELVFTYTVAAPDENTALDYSATNSLTLNGATITNGADNAILTLPALGGGSSLVGSKTFKVDAVVRQITSVTYDAAYAGIKKAGDILLIRVNLNRPVTVTGSPQLFLNTTNAGVYATYSGNTGAYLLFKYTIRNGDNSAALDYEATSSLNPNGGSIQQPGYIDINLALPALAGGSSLVDDISLIVDAEKPTVLSVANSAGASAANYAIGDLVEIKVKFSEPLVVTAATAADKPRLLLETGATDDTAIYVSTVAADTTLIFSYTVQAGDTAKDLNYKATNSLFLSGVGTIEDAAGNSAILTLPSTSSDSSLAKKSEIIINGIKPSVVKVTSTTSNGSYKVGAGDIVITVEFDEAITVNTGGGDPTLTLAGVVDGAVAYTSTVGKIMTFTYTIGAGDNTSDLDYANETALTLTGSTIINALNSNAADTTLPTPGTYGSLGRNKDIVIDNLADIIVDSVKSTTPDGIYGIRRIVYVNVYFSDKVLVTGKPFIRVNTDANGDTAYYASGNKTNKLTFKYTIQEDDFVDSLNYYDDASLQLNLGTITDFAGNNASLSLAAVTTSKESLDDNNAITIDGVKPTISNISGVITSGGGDGFGNTNDSITITVVFDKIVNVTGTPKLLLETGKTDRYAIYNGGTGNDSLTFGYKVVAGDTTSVLNVKKYNSLSGGTIKDTVGNTADLTLGTSMLSASTLVIDAIPPTVVKVTSTNGNGYYNEGDIITIKVVFSEIVSGAIPTLQVNAGRVTNPTLTGAIPALGDGKTYEYTYTVIAEDENADLNYVNTSSLVGTISDGKGNSVIDPILPDLTSRNSLAGNKNLYVDAKAPTISSVTTPNAVGTYGVGSSIYIKVTYNDKVKVSGKPKIKLNIATSPVSDVFAIYHSGSGSNILQLKYTVNEGETSAVLDLDSDMTYPGTSSIKDFAGNIAVVTVPGLGLGKNIAIDGSLKSAEIEYASITSISESNQNDKFNVSVYPNPSINGEIVLNFSGNANSKQVEIQIYNIVGNLVSADKVQISNKVVLQKQLESGIYIMSVLKDNEVYNQRIMVE